MGHNMSSHILTHQSENQVAAVQVPRSVGGTREDMDAGEKLEDNALYKQSQMDVVSRCAVGVLLIRQE